MINSQVFVVIHFYYDGCNVYDAEYHALELQEAFDATIPPRPKNHKGLWGEDRSWYVKTLNVY
jgi:hypothetical protein